MDQMLYDYAPPRAEGDLRSMLRHHVMARCVARMEEAEQRRAAIATAEDWDAYQHEVRRAIDAIYADLPVGPGRPIEPRTVASHDRGDYRIENVLFESWPGWEVNASCYVPVDMPPPWPVIVVPVGHTGKQFASYQVPAQVFARCGYLAIVFDPPGQRGEKREGNDHWRDGVRPWLLGEGSTRYFVADALRCIDYAATRSDTDLSRGVAMTGVSGGGNTTIFAGSLDERIALLGPCCCTSPMALDAGLNLPPCPEIYTPGRFAARLDDIDILLASLPKPICMLAGTRDSLHTPERVRAVFEEVRRLYGVRGVDERTDLFLDDSPHAYTFAMARHFVRFADRWLRGEPDRALPKFTEADCPLVDAEMLQCKPNPKVNMHTLSRDRGRRLAASRSTSPDQVRDAVRRLTGAGERIDAPTMRRGEPYHTLFHTCTFTELLLTPEPDAQPGIELPGGLIAPLPEAGPAAGAMLWFDDAGRWARLRKGGPLAKLAADQPPLAVASVDLRGWGETTPIEVPTEVYGWTHPMRGISYMAAALNDSLAAMRIRDGLAWWRWLRGELGGEVSIAVGGAGLGGVVALHVAALAESVAGVYVTGALARFQDLLEADRPGWEAEAYLPGVLNHYDLPDLVAALPCPALLHDPRAGDGEPLSERVARDWYPPQHATLALAEPPAPTQLAALCQGRRVMPSV